MTAEDLRQQFEKETGLTYKWINHKRADVTWDGTSYRKDEYIEWLESKLTAEGECDVCHGKGTLLGFPVDQKCYNCNGTGHRPMNKE